ncbi:MAG: hypothetical protein WBF52_10685, partial [Geitlerinemataceae cyanobacterium]
GQVDVVDADSNRVTISATLPDWATVIPQRDDRSPGTRIKSEGGRNDRCEYLFPQFPHQTHTTDSRFNWG